MNSLIQNLKRGKESCNQIIKMLQNLQSPSRPDDDDDDDDDKGNNISYLKGLDDHFKVVETTLDDALAMLRSYDFIEDVMQMSKPKVRRTDMNDSPNHYCKCEDKFGCHHIHNHLNSSKDRRGCYKRRRNQQERIIETPSLTDDGHAWRKYGQKVILHSTHPRNYYRCTHKYEEGCQASKQVQQISENPPKYKIIYHGHHTCKASTSKNNPTTLLDSTDDNNQNSILLSFETGKQALNYPFMFPSTTPSSSSSSSGVAMLTGTSIKEEVIAAELSNGAHNNQYTSPSPDQYVAPSPDVTAITAVSDNVSSVHGVDADECYSHILADVLINLDDDIYNQPNTLMMTKLMTTC